MKKISLITSVALIASLGLVGCGGGGSVDSSAQGNISIAGTAIDPELQHATVCLDLNQYMDC
jgi:ABC-type glycerol-3-phosphate transport system substrate-binding protein